MTTSLVTQKKQELSQYLEKGIAEIQKAAIEEVDPKHLIRVLLTAATKTPKLFNCSFESFSLALLTATQLGLEINGYHAHVVPFGQECQLIIDYKGLVKLAYKVPNILSIHAAAIYRDDDFDYGFGTGLNHFLKHHPAIDDRGDLIGAYAMAKLEKGEDVFVVMMKEDIEKRRNVSKSSSQDSPWIKWKPEMYMKTAIKALAKLIPLGDKVEAVIEYENKLAAIDVEYKEQKRTSTLAELQQNQAESKSQESPQKKIVTPVSNKSILAPSQYESIHVYDRILMLFDDLSYGEAARVEAYAEMGVKSVEELDETQANRFESILTKRLDDLARKL